MPTLKEKARDFLAHKRIAIAGVSRTKEDAANGIYRRLKELGYQVYPVNPHAETFDDDPCYPTLTAIPGEVDGVVIATNAAVASEIVEQCIEKGVPRVWMHRGLAFLGSSVSDEAKALAEQNGITCIPGGCPMMFAEPVDFGHKCIRWVLGATGSLPY